MDDVIVAGIWELGWNVPLSESYLWSFPLREFDVMDWRMTPVTAIQHNERYSGMTLTEYDTTEEMVNSIPDEFVRVYIDEKGEIPLFDFVHPPKAAYLFGKAGESPIRLKKNTDQSVRIVTRANNGVMWPHQCLVTVLHDRLRKTWQQM